ncbi:hypothetical protein CVT26_001225 [Gymnopilus dilepis]|uniref:Uncharacterized protein n=1 Tax=Gymnopilus dilepis TaxID=231916 RepID=A0A409WBI8_9AGAR|nr:hypothetical protein CVT26_001225 [Gymnopilus dilepis]
MLFFGEDVAPQDPDPIGLFDNDEMASTRSGNSRRASSSEVSRHPTSESEGDEDEDEENEGPRTRRASKVWYVRPQDARLRSSASAPLPFPPRASSKNSKGAKSSAPRVSTVKIESDTEDTPKVATSWPAHACLKASFRLSLDPICALCPVAVKIVEKTLITEHAWPELHQAQAYKKLVLSSAVTSLLEKDRKTYEPIQKRVAEDEKSVKIVGKWASLCDRSTL